MIRKLAALLVLSACACAESPVPPPPPRPLAAPFIPSPPDPDATRYQDLSAADRAAVDSVEQWAELQSGAATAAAWSRYVGQVERAALAAKVTP